MGFNKKKKKRNIIQKCHLLMFEKANTLKKKKLATNYNFTPFLFE